MSNALQISTLMDNGLIPAINAAWPGVTIDEDDRPRTIQDLPLCELNWEDIHIDMGHYNAAVGETNQSYTFEIILYFPMPPASGTSAGKVSRIKANYASALIAQLQTGPGFAGIANMPIVTHVSAKERSPRFDNGAAMVRLRFTCQVAADHH